MRPPLKTSLRGYGGHHQALRAKVTPAVASGTVKCWRCGRLIRSGEPWDLGPPDAGGGRRFEQTPEVIAPPLEAAVFALGG